MLMFFVCASFARAVSAVVPTNIPVAPEPVGSGARALGQSAFIAVADDATAASWNPAGLINLERPEASFVGAWKNTTCDFLSAYNNISYDGDSWSEGEINFMSYAQPIEIGKTDVVLSVNYHQVYDLGIEYSWRTKSMVVKGKSEGAVSAYSLAAGLSIPSHPEITIGASFNWYTQSLLNDYARQVNITTRYDRPYGAPPVYTSITETLDDFRGHNFTFGLLWDVYEKQENLLTLGFVCHTPFTAKVNQKVVEIKPSGVFPDGPYHLDIDFPLSLGAGVNYRISDSLSAAFDIEWKEWSEFKYPGTTRTPQSDTLAFRLGAEHLTFLKGARESVLACRGGIFYEPRPAWDDIVPIYGFSAGLGWTVGEQFSLDFAYQFRWGEEDLQNFDYSVKEQFFVVSLIKYF
jgi:long-subunit fatty acid transport protein